MDTGADRQCLLWLCPAAWSVSLSFLLLLYFHNESKYTRSYFIGLIARVQSLLSYKAIQQLFSIPFFKKKECWSSEKIGIVRKLESVSPYNQSF